MTLLANRWFLWVPPAPAYGILGPVMSLSTTIHDVKTLVLSFHPLILIDTLEEERVEALLISVAAELKIAHFEWSVSRGLSRIPGGNPIYGTADPLNLVKHLSCLTLEGVFHLKDFGRFLQDPTVVRQFRELLGRLFQKRAAVVITGPAFDLPPEIEGQAARYQLQMPGREELREVVRNVISSLNQSHRIQVLLGPSDIDPLLNALSGLTVNQARQAIAYVALEDGRFAGDDIGKIVDRKIQAIQEGGLLEYFPVEDNSFSLAGFAKLKEWLDRARVGFSAEAKKLNLRPPKGILILGVQGCGKSLAVKFVARRWKMPLLKLEAGRLYDKYIGESEKNLRKAIRAAEALAPVILWIDELEKALTGSTETDGGVSRRLLGALLTWLQEQKEGVFVAATANDVWSLPPELLRKGRFDEIFFTDLPDLVERAEILHIHLEIRKQDPARFDLVRLAEIAEGFSGAEIEQAVVAALYRALHEKRGLDSAVLQQEIKATVPLSVSRREDIERMRRMADGRFVRVS